MKITLFQHFAGAEDLKDLKLLKTELGRRNIKTILDLAIEADLDAVLDSSSFDKTMQRLIDTIQNSADSFVAIKATALGDPRSLQHIASACAYALQSFDAITSYIPEAAGAQEKLTITHITDWINSLPGAKSVSTVELTDIHRRLSDKGAPENPLMIVNPLSHPHLFVGDSPACEYTITATVKDTDIIAFRGMLERFTLLVNEAKKSSANLMLDAEQTYFQPGIDLLHLLSPIHQAPVVYNTYQMYLKSSTARMLRDVHSRPMGVKLVRGAYIVSERQYAKDNKLHDPTQPNIEATHKAYDRAAALLEARHIPLVLATHNWASIEKAIGNPRAGFAQLYGMGDWMTVEVARRGLPSYKYVPFGTVQETVPYLLRRAQENSSILGGVGIDLAYLRSAIMERFGRRSSKISD